MFYKTSWTKTSLGHKSSCKTSKLSLPMPHLLLSNVKMKRTRFLLTSKKLRRTLIKHRPSLKMPKTRLSSRQLSWTWPNKIRLSKLFNLKIQLATTMNANILLRWAKVIIPFNSKNLSKLRMSLFNVTWILPAPCIDLMIPLPSLNSHSKLSCRHKLLSKQRKPHMMPQELS
jgi:hypothetical protein